MGQSPKIGNRRVIRKKSGSGQPARRTRKERGVTAGSMHMKARRETILGEELGGAEMRVCGECASVFHDKHWHDARLAGGRSRVLRADLRKATCTACSMRRGKGRAAGYVGEVLITGSYTDDELREIVRLIRNVGKRAQRRDSQDRILGIERSKEGLRVRTTENQLAVSIGKQVHKARKGAELTITWSHHDKPVRVRIVK